MGCNAAAITSLPNFRPFSSTFYKLKPFERLGSELKPLERLGSKLKLFSNILMT
jgi:hypothetical protein